MTDEQIKKRQKTYLKNKVRGIFTGGGFKYIPIGGYEMFIGSRKVEIDSMFIYKNIWLVCEDTVKTTHVREHIRTKNEAFGEIKNNLEDFRELLIKKFPDQENLFKEYPLGRIKVCGLYISKHELDIEKCDCDLFSNLQFVQPKTLEYFQRIVSSIKNSAKFEIFRFLKLESKDIGISSSSSDLSNISAPIIYPSEYTGLNNEVRVVSFMMSAEALLNTCYVLRKDNWNDSIWLYQRLIDKNRIKSIREFIEKKGACFYNNVIVGLPDNVQFVDSEGNPKLPEEIKDITQRCSLIIPNEMNSVCVIDGQHRIYAHYESGNDSKQERKISQLRKQLHLLVTGLIFPRDMRKEDRTRIQSEIFLDINSNSKPVPQNVLLHIKRLNNPIADESLAQLVVEQLNKKGPFKSLLQISSLDPGKIKTASIVRFALRYLITIKPQDGKESLFNYWEGDKEELLQSNEDTINDYVNFCSKVINMYFSAISSNNKNWWNDDNSKILSVTAINGFIMALTRQLKINAIRDYQFYDEIFKGWNIDFSKENFPYVSSQYRKFSNQILTEAFKVSEGELLSI